jgi:hydroxymethylglutaryl-CoA lyase
VRAAQAGETAYDARARSRHRDRGGPACQVRCGAQRCLEDDPRTQLLAGPAARPRDHLRGGSARWAAERGAPHPPTADKVAFIDALSKTGLRHIEITSFVNPRWIPQLADAADVAARITRQKDVHYSCLVPNKRGLENALAAGMREVAVFLSASETHNKKNVNKTIAETLAAFEEVIQPAREAGVRVRAYVSTVFGCPYEGAVDPDKVVALVKELRARGVYQVSLGDTIGVATPLQVRDVLGRVLDVAPREELALHFHDTRGTALANVLMGLGLGLTTIDSAVGGLGGCPYAPGAAGNLATEDLLYMLDGMGVETGVDLAALVACSQKIAALVGHDLPSKYLKAAIGQQVRRGRSAG